LGNNQIYTYMNQTLTIAGIAGIADYFLDRNFSKALILAAIVGVTAYLVYNNTNSGDPLAQ
jgi:hypothetical protein